MLYNILTDIQGELEHIDIQSIYEPEPIPFSFETVGWKIVAILIVVIICISVFFALRNYHRNRYRREALQQLNDTKSLTSAFVVLKKTALSAFGREATAQLHGQKWLAFLDQTGKNVHFLYFEKEINAFLYKDQVPDKTIQHQIITNAKNWIKTHACKL